MEQMQGETLRWVGQTLRAGGEGYEKTEGQSARKAKREELLILVTTSKVAKNVTGRVKSCTSACPSSQLVVVSSFVRSVVHLSPSLAVDVQRPDQEQKVSKECR